MPQPAATLTRRQLVELAGAALTNSGLLLDDAQLLLTAGRWPRAYGLAVLAAEEFGKFMLCATATLTLDVADAASWSDFWKKFRSHQKKFVLWFGQYVDQQDWGPVGLAGDEEWLRAWDSRPHEARLHDLGKQSGLYVNFDAGSVHAPDEVVAEETAAKMFAMVASVIGPWMQEAEMYLAQLLNPDPRIAAMIAEMRALGEVLPDERSTEALDAFMQKYLLGSHTTNTRFEDGD
ncbi:AbiV family abortive infection protein [Lentzea aerocolonigenes]|uniref:AbiV family abortive infection protein n=1 Tax=Lentzea aerocolonigenes TaxID=68170 RepID=UPI0006970520|nr:AbiV family abortive infection protein [Lentzea aerocolonigenes]